MLVVNTLRLTQNGCYFADVFKCIFLNENVWILLIISLKFVPKVWINNIPALVQIMAWSWSGDKPLSEPIMVSLLTHVCVSRPQWVNLFYNSKAYGYRSGWTLAQVMACCLMAQSHYQSQCWLMISEVLWYSLEGNLTGNVQYIYIYILHMKIESETVLTQLAHHIIILSKQPS